MIQNLKFRNLIFTLFIATLLAETTGCGTIFRPERKGQKDGKIDLMIALLDAVGLLFFIIPGVIAYAVDFADGTIYLPPGRESDNSGTMNTSDMVAIHLGKENMSEENIRKVIYEKTGKDIGLNSANMEVYKLGPNGEKIPVNADVSGKTAGNWSL